MTRPKVVIIGAGFGGLFTARQLARTNVDVLMVDRNNYHTFSPLIYQVATCGLDIEDVAYPVRKIFARSRNIKFMLGEVIDIRPHESQIEVRTNGRTLDIDYDYLIMAAGSVTNYFGNAEIEENALPLKTIEDSVRIRNHILRLFEKADWMEDEVVLRAMTTMVVVGGGPTGLETAGAMLELYDNVLRHEYPRLRDMPPRVILVEATDTLLRPYPESLQQSALAQIEAMGVEVLLGKMVKSYDGYRVQLSDGSLIDTRTLVWATGVKGSPLAGKLSGDLARGGRIPVEPTMRVKGIDNVYALGDIAYLEDPDGNPYPQLIPVAQQQAKLAAKNILRRTTGVSEKHFTYFDKGTMATIGRRRAVAWVFNRVPVSGFIAWLAWLGLHLITLIGFRNQLNVFVNWVWNYIRFSGGGHNVLLEFESETAHQQEFEVVKNAVDYSMNSGSPQDISQKAS